MHMRNLKCSTLGILLLAAPVAAFAAALIPSPARLVLPVYNAAQMKTVCAAAIAKAQQRAGEIEALPVSKVNIANTIDAWNRMSADFEDAEGVIYRLGSVHPDKAARDASDECQLKITEFRTEMMQREPLYQRFLAIKPVAPHARKFKRDLIEAFEDTGVVLPVDKRARVKEIIQRLELLRQEFDRNVRDNKTRLSFAPEELAGMPQDYLDKAKRDDKGNFLLGFDYPDYLPFMANADDESARKRYYLAFQNRGGDRNLVLMDESMRLNLELAKLYGLPSYAHYIIRRRMAETPENVNAFLDGVTVAVRDAEKREVEELRTLKAATLGKPLANVAIGRWDVAYYQEKVRKSRYAIDQEALRKYFPTMPSVNWVLDVASRLYGVKFQEVKVPAWHEDVRYYDVRDAATGKFLSGIYLDLFPRDGKYKHAAAFPVRSVSTNLGRTPVSVLVTNFDRKGLTHSEVETMFHEFGHVLHGVLSRTEYDPQGGTSVMRDFVEAPSQMFEEWARRKESIALLGRSCKDCPTLDPELINRLDDARRYGAGVRYSRQHLYAAFDMQLSGPKPGPSLETWVRLEGATPLGYVSGTQFPGSFSHLLNGYGAGYYGYMWSEVLALDMLSAYDGNIMNPKVGHRFRDVILANGGQVPAQDLVRKFLGRAPNSKAFFAEISGTR
jgi:thimet oligopeptidase